MKKIILISALLIIGISPSLFAKKGFGADLTVPLGAGIGFFQGDSDKHPNGGFEFGIYLKPNYYWDFSFISFGLSLEVGYQRDIYAYKEKNNRINGSITFDSFSLGFIPKIDVIFLSIGFGGGIKFPLGGNKLSSVIYGKKELEKYNYKELKKNFGENLLIPYIKASLDFMLIPNFALGIYIAYDFPFMAYNENNSNIKIKFSSLDIGGQITLRF